MVKDKAENRTLQYQQTLDFSSQINASSIPAVHYPKHGDAGKRRFEQLESNQGVWSTGHRPLKPLSGAVHAGTAARARTPPTPTPGVPRDGAGRAGWSR
ncbi:hypothetical protein EYF80_060605 [Liparis tanakae]|uniref:Uncharacterized protein n=1 Tax=Liparis tanakae TaxID=230148 RepID=A0A4Z2EJY8_9TELE|nr:hypothetical protein EYF80_060605 [Liparis tanakae]